MPFLLTDTVGFIRKLPTQLVDSFKSTLTEITEADLIIHVVDISHISFEDHIKSVNIILSEIKASDKPTIMLFNKTDKFSQIIDNEADIFENQMITLKKLKSNLKKMYEGEVYFVSALNKLDINKLKEDLYKSVRKIHVTRFPYNAFLYPDIKWRSIVSPIPKTSLADFFGFHCHHKQIEKLNWLK